MSLTQTKSVLILVVGRCWEIAQIRNVQKHKIVNKKTIEVLFNCLYLGAGYTFNNLKVFMVS